ncbi:MAG: Fis family transcriptional regulator [Proteobacteria bacterium]|nr:MAG: Fis family transcriptional regulator [Pseudomonadota bacterium]
MSQRIVQRVKSKPVRAGGGSHHPTAPEDRQKLLLEIANVLNTNLEPELLLESIARVVRSFVHIDRATLALYDRDRDEFQIVALALQESSRIGKGWSIPHSGSRCGKVFDSQQPYLSVLDPSTRFYEDSPLTEEGMHTSLVLPLTVNATAMGTFNVNWRSGESEHEADIELLSMVADQIAIAVSNSRAFERIRSDAEGLKRENQYLLELVQNKDAPSLLFNCPSLAPLVERLMTVAKVDATVLVGGETGTGKGVVARTIHAWSSRRARPFVKCDCAALAPSLIESELFGHERGAFTGATSRRIGRFELAHGATIFLDEIGELPLSTQAKLLGVLQDRQIQRVGGTTSIPVDIRVIAASNRDLAQEVKAGRFREDLYYRLNVVTVSIPPLRERRNDILPLAHHFLATYARDVGRKISGISAASRAKLVEYPWPGNIRELENVIERAVLLNAGDELEIGTEVLPIASSAPAAVAAETTELLPLAEVEARHIRAVLRHTRGRVSGPEGAARILGLNASTLRSRMKKLDIKAERA